MSTTRKMTTIEKQRLPELQATYKQYVGEETRSPNRTFLLRKIREALEALPAATPPPRPMNARLAALTTTADLATEDDAEDVGETLVDEVATTATTATQDADVALQAVVEGAPSDVVESALHEPPSDDTAADEGDAEHDEGAQDARASTAVAPITTVEAEAPVLAIGGGPVEATAAPVNDSVAPRPRRTRRASTTSTETPRPPRGPRGRFTSMTIEELQVLYRSVVGRDTGSSHRGYLVWKVREAEKGRIPIGPRDARPQAGEASSDARILPLRLDARHVEAIDSTWRAKGMKSRMDFLRRALGHYLAELGAHEAAAMFATPGAAPEPAHGAVS
ncbi:MAG: hypothetical protein ACHREM_12765 [Polyangiales bacterium]